MRGSSSSCDTPLSKFQKNLQSIIRSFSTVRYRQYGQMTSSTTLFHFKPSLLHCSASTASSSHSLSLKFIFPARPQRPLFPTVQIQSRPSTPRASSRTAVATENDSGSGKALHIYSFKKKKKEAFFILKYDFLDFFVVGLYLLQLEISFALQFQVEGKHLHSWPHCHVFFF